MYLTTYNEYRCWVHLLSKAMTYTKDDGEHGKWCR